MTIKERPILFSAPMVRAILDGRKSQTRRIAKVTDDGCKPGMITPLAGFVPRSIANHVSYCPHGVIGDRLWVRETWQHENYPLGPYDSDCQVFYRADYMDDPLGVDLEKSTDGFRRKWNPSIHMPRSASRILLEITNVRVERLQDISEEDAIAEGCLKFPFEDDSAYTFYQDDKTGHASHTGAYRNLWESINGQGSWDLNPWVWVIEFKSMDKNHGIS